MLCKASLLTNKVLHSQYSLCMTGLQERWTASADVMFFLPHFFTWWNERYRC